AGNAAESRKALDQALVLSPHNPAALNNRAWQRIEDGELDAAMQDVDRALGVAPNHPDILDTRCFALTALGRVEEALADCKRAAARRNTPTTEGMIAFLEHRNSDAVWYWRMVKSPPSLRRQLAPWIAKASPRQ